MRGARFEIKQTVVDRIVSYINPRAGLDRLRARYQTALASAYLGGSKSRRATKNWRTSNGDADTDILPDLPELRSRSRDLVRNAPLATGAINTKVTNIIGGGLKLHCRIDREFLGLTDDEADEWERNAQREFKLWAKSQDCSADRLGNFYEIQDLVYRSTLENGDIFCLLPLIPRKKRPYKLAIRLIESDRVSNPSHKSDTQKIAGGIERDETGTPTHIHVLKGHPGNPRSKQTEWSRTPIFGSRSGRRNVLHIFKRLRVGQVRGVPDLAPVIESLKQISTYTEAEISAAVVSGMFTVFVKTEDGLNPLDDDGTSTIDESGNEIKLGNGAIVDLAKGEDVSFANPSRPNTNFDPFVMAILRQVGVALEIPLELLIMHFTASYSASRAALEQAWKFFKARRGWLAEKLCDPVYEEWLTEAIETGRIAAPGFLDGDPAIRAAYLGCTWIGPAKGHIQPLQEIQAEVEAVKLGSKTLDLVTAETTGEDWEHTHRQRVKEIRRRKADGIGVVEKRQPDPPDSQDDADEPEEDDEGADQVDKNEENEE